MKLPIRVLFQVFECHFVCHQKCELILRRSFPLSYLTDVDVTTPDEKSVITYVSTLYDVFPKVPEGVEGISANVSREQQDL